MNFESLYQVFWDVASTHADKVAYQYKLDGHWVDVTWNDVGQAVSAASKSLMKLGVFKGDRVSILSQTRLEWVMADFGIVCGGGVTVGIYHSNLAQDCAYVVEHSDSEVIFVENAVQLEKILSVRAELPKLRHIIAFEGPSDAANHVLSWDDFLRQGQGVSDEQAKERGSELRGDDLASLVYTSGTTGVPKGAMITHRNLIFTSDSAGEVIYLEPHYNTLLFLPLAHVFARLIAYCCMRRAIRVAFAEDITKLGENIKETRPYFLPSVPRVYEKVYDKIISGVEEAGGVKQKLFNWAVGVGYEVSRLQQRKQPIPFGLSLKHGLANRLVLHKIQAALGGRLVYAISGAAPLNKTIAEFFHACGVLILEGIGMTENTSFTNVNEIEHNKFGTVGRVGPNIEMRLAEDGEVLFRGDNVMKGYFKSPEATAETIDTDGWLHTGDIGEIDADGYLKITDRKKDLIVTAGGKNVAPQRIERIMRTSHYVAQCVAYGDKRKYITALITLDPETIADWARSRELDPDDTAALAAHFKTHELIRGEIERLNEQLASFETIKDFHVLPRDLTIEDGELTPTLKIKRKVVIERYGEQLEALYAKD